MKPVETSGNKSVSVMQIALAVGILGFLTTEIWQGAQLREIAVAVEEIKSSQALPEQNNDSDPPLPFEMRSASDVSSYLDPFFRQKGRIKEKAQALSSVDSWILHPEDEQKALSIIDEKVTTLGREILDQVKSGDANALKVPQGKQAMQLFSQGSSLLALYPMPNDEASQKEFSDFLAVRDTTSRKIQELRRLRYNQWAIEQIEAGYMGYHANLAKVQKWEDDPKLVDSAATSLQMINPDFLDVSAMELYMGLIRLTNESVDEAHKITLAKRLNNPAVSKKSPEDF